MVLTLCQLKETLMSGLINHHFVANDTRVLRACTSAILTLVPLTPCQPYTRFVPDSTLISHVLQQRLCSIAGQARTLSGDSAKRNDKWKYVDKIRETIKDDKHKKWGLLMHRCDCASDDLWTKLLAAIDQVVETGLGILQAEDLRDTLEMALKNDKHTLDGATIDQSPLHISEMGPERRSEGRKQQRHKRNVGLPQVPVLRACGC